VAANQLKASFVIHLVTRLPLPYHQTLSRTLHAELNGNFCAWFAERQTPEFPFQSGSEDFQFRHYYLAESGYGKLWSALRQNRDAAVILGGWSSPMTKKTLLMTTALRVPVFIWADHPHPRQRRWLTAASRRLHLRLLSRTLVRGFLACGEMTVQHLAGLGIAGDKIFNFPYWVDLPASWSLPQRCFQPQDQPRPFRLLAVGRHVAGKSFNVAIRAIKLANERSGSLIAELIIVGDGPERASLEELVAALNLGESVCFTGWLENSEVQKEMARSDALVVPSEFEGYGVAVREALAQGRPVLCSDRVIAALDEHIESNAILLHSVGDAQGLANHILLLAGEADVLRRASEEARKLAEQWHPRRAFKILQQAVREQRILSNSG
jgi:glycosyltransferase involved in cell wall biosynthesis